MGLPDAGFFLYRVFSGPGDFSYREGNGSAR
jgi:hypothetical protein